jgi:hypothetical protein
MLIKVDLTVEATFRAQGMYNSSLLRYECYKVSRINAILETE